jgi:hypothetical protein
MTFAVLPPLRDDPSASLDRFDGVWRLAEERGW